MTAVHQSVRTIIVKICQIIINTLRSVTCPTAVFTTIIQTSFIHENGNRRYRFLVLGREESYFLKERSDSKRKYTADDIANYNMLDWFSSQNIFVGLRGDFPIYSRHSNGHKLRPSPSWHISVLIGKGDPYSVLLSARKKQLVSQYNFTYRYMHIDDVLSINNPAFENYLGQMYPADLEIKDEQHLYFLLGFSPVNRDGRSAAHFP